MSKKTKILLILIISVAENAVSFSQSTEYMLKAGFIEKFARFITWPESSNMNDKKSPFKIKVLGKSPFNGEIEIMYEKIKINKKKVQIDYISKIEEIKNCNVLFICKSEKDNLKTIIDSVGIKPILLLGETKGYSQKGVHFNFYVRKDETLHFEINPDSIKKSNLKVDMYLLEFGKIIN